MDGRARLALGVAGTAGLFAAIHLGGLVIVAPLLEVGPVPGTGTDDPRFGVWFVIGLLIATAIMLGAFRWGLAWLVRGVVLLVSFGLAWFVLAAVLPSTVVFAGIDPLPALGAALVVGALYRHPEWYVLDLAGVLIGAGAVALLGITLGVRAVLVLLVLLTVYDVISVYGTKHMLSLAS